MPGISQSIDNRPEATVGTIGLPWTSSVVVHTSEVSDQGQDLVQPLLNRGDCLIVPAAETAEDMDLLAVIVQNPVVAHTERDQNDWPDLALVVDRSGPGRSRVEGFEASRQILVSDGAVVQQAWVDDLHRGHVAREMEQGLGKLTRSLFLGWSV